MSSSDSDKNSITEVAGESFVRERPLEIQRGAVLAGRYQVEEIIGKGGSGVVLRVFDRTVQSVVALKVLKAELARDTKWDKRFSRELRLGRPIQHPNVCRIFDIGEADGHRFLTMELATGGSLRDELKRRPALERPLADRLADARAAIEGLAAIHASGVVHRDFKPDNLLRMEDGRLVISDFGLATDAATAPGVTVMIGTPHYMAPEVLAGEPATARSDVWALGVVLHEIVFGRRPERKAVSFDGSGKGPVRASPGIESAMLELCEACLDDAPLSRPADAREVAARFDRALQPKPKWSRIRLGRLLAASAVFAAVVLGVVTARTYLVRTRSLQIAVGGGPATRSRPHLVGQAHDWSKLSRTVASFTGRVHCFSMLNDHTARVVWGVPRRATDVDVNSGRFAASNLSPESFRSSCPDVSSSTGNVVYAARNSAGVTEIRLSTRSDAADAVPLTSGRDPLWLGARPAFVYVVDESHVALFSLATMRFDILPPPADGGKLEIGDIAVSATGNFIAASGYDSTAEARVQVFRRDDEAPVGQFPVPLGSRLVFGWTDSELLLAGPMSESERSVAMLNTNSGLLTRLGRLPGMDITRVSAAPGQLGFVARRLSSDVWSYTGPGRTRLTNDGDVMSAAISRSGDLLLERRAADGALRIWLRRAQVPERQLSQGRKDVAPAFSPDGSSWVYADYEKSTIRVCGETTGCRVLFSDPGLPTLPTYSPGGNRLAVLTQLGRPQIKILGTDGSTIVTWDAMPVCAAVWSSDQTIWSVENVRGSYYWAEHNATTGEGSGRRVAFANPNPEDSAVFDCRAKGAGADSVFFRPIEVEIDEASEVRVAERGSL
jgi:serine/threonine protein kinase